jgi:hypothetical protein
MSSGIIFMVSVAACLTASQARFTVRGDAADMNNTIRSLFQKLKALRPKRRAARRRRRSAPTNQQAKLRFWVLINAIATGLIVASYKGALGFMWRADATHLSLATWLIFFILAAFIGNLTMKQGAPGRDERQDRRYINGCWFAAEALMGLGLCGTVIGILLLFTGSAGGLDPGNVSVMRTAILSMSQGLTTAFVTTLSGIATSLLAKLLLVNLDLENPDAPEDA